MTEPNIPEYTNTLPRNIKREAIPTIIGYDYQVWIAMNLWFDLNHNGIMFLEGAEDIDSVDGDQAKTIQIRHTKDAISLNNEIARESIRLFWKLKQDEQDNLGRDVRYVYFTTSTPALEQNAEFDGMKGIEAWEYARYDEAWTRRVANYLAKNISGPASLVEFLKNSQAEALQEQLFKRFSWLTAQPNIDLVMDVVIDKIGQAIQSLYDTIYPRAALEQISKQLHAFCWQQIRRPDLPQRVLTKKILVEQLRASTTVHFTLPMHASSSILGAATQLGLQSSANSIHQLVETAGLLPHPTLQRRHIVADVVKNLQLRQPVLLTGSVFQGKTTIGILASNRFCPNAWWVDMKDRAPAQLREIFNLFSSWIGSGEAPSLIVFDDVDTSLTHLAVYDRALQKFLYRCSSLGKAVLLTARGSTEEVREEVTNAWNAKNLLIESLTSEEIADEAMSLGCPKEHAKQWGAIVHVQTSGHAKLVQVRLNELRKSDWPRPTSEQLLMDSQAVTSARQLARTLLSESLQNNGSETEFVYTAAEFSLSPERETLLSLGDLIPNLNAPGDLLARLEGKWLELVSKNRFRVTPLIRAVKGETWSESRFKLAHQRIFDALAQKRSLTVAEGAALVFHGYISDDPQRLTKATFEVTRAPNQEIRSAIYRNLIWLPSLNKGSGEQLMPGHPFASQLLRQLQFQVAASEGVDVVPVLNAWWNEVQADESEGAGLMLHLLNGTVMTSSAHLPFNLLMRSAKSLSMSTGSFGEKFFEKFSEILAQSVKELPPECTVIQAFLSLKPNTIASLPDFEELVSWVESEQETSVLAQFDEIIVWPIVQGMGAFVHGAWLHYSKQTTTWTELTQVFRHAWNVAKVKGLRNWGIEIAKALSIIQCEYEDSLSGGLEILDEATNDFGMSALLEEQRANCHFHSRQYEKVLIVWMHLLARFPTNSIGDPFAYRRAGIAASELKLWEDAAMYFERGATACAEAIGMPTRSGLLAEAALALSRNRNVAGAVSTMQRCLSELPSDASESGNPRWEAMLRVLAAAAVQIRGDTPMTPEGEPFNLAPGFASNPELSMKNTDDLQSFRVAQLRVEISVSRLYVDPDDVFAHEEITRSLYAEPQVSWMVANHMITMQLRKGITADFIEYVEREREISEYLRSCSPYKDVPYDALHMVYPYYLLAIILRDMGPEDLVGLAACLPDDFTAEQSRKAINLISAAMSKTYRESIAVLTDDDAPSLERCGAALTIMGSDFFGPQELACAQAFIAPILMRALLALRQSDMHSQVAKRFAQHWKIILARPLNIKNPEWTLPAMYETIRDVERQKAGLQELLRCASSLSGVKFNGILEALPKF